MFYVLIAAGTQVTPQYNIFAQFFPVILILCCILFSNNQTTKKKRSNHEY